MAKFTGAHTVKLVSDTVVDLGTSTNPIRTDPTGSTAQPVYPLAPARLNASSGGTAITTNTNTQIVAAPSAGFHLKIHRLWAQNSSSTGTWCYWGNGSGIKTIPFYLAQNQPMMMNLQGSWELSSVTALYMNTVTTGANIEWFVEYEIEPD